MHPQEADNRLRMAEGRFSEPKEYLDAVGRLDPSRAMTILKRGLRLVCPRCGKGRLYHTLFSMVPECPECGLPCEPEMGYYVGAIYINYGLTTLIALAGYFILDVYTSISLNWQSCCGPAFAPFFH